MPELIDLRASAASATARYDLAMDKRIAVSIIVNITTNGTCMGAINVALPPGVTFPAGGFAWIGDRNQTTGSASGVDEQAVVHAVQDRLANSLRSAIASQACVEGES